ncbi:hypothetical protein RT99_18605 [Flavobacterium sp. MEB061]|nr:hypothetical protein RT99_18605 [Flavobacterium sp. MEB061]
MLIIIFLFNQISFWQLQKYRNGLSQRNSFSLKNKNLYCNQNIKWVYFVIFIPQKLLYAFF